MKPWDTQIVQHHLQAWKHGNCDKGGKVTFQRTPPKGWVMQSPAIWGLQDCCIFAPMNSVSFWTKTMFLNMFISSAGCFRGEEFLKHRQPPKYPLICIDGHLTCSLSHFTRHWFEHSRWWFILPSCTMSSQIFHIFLFFQIKVSANWHRFLYENNAAVQAPRFLNHVQVVRYHQASGGGIILADHLRWQFYWWPFSGWWLNQPIWKIWSSNWITSPGRDENKTNLKSPPSLWPFWDGDSPWTRKPLQVVSWWPPTIPSGFSKRTVTNWLIEFHDLEGAEFYYQQNIYHIFVGVEFTPNHPKSPQIIPKIIPNHHSSNLGFIHSKFTSFQIILLDFLGLTNWPPKTQNGAPANSSMDDAMTRLWTAWLGDDVFFCVERKRGDLEITTQWTWDHGWNYWWRKPCITRDV